MNTQPSAPITGVTVCRSGPHAGQSLPRAAFAGQRAPKVTGHATCSAYCPDLALGGPCKERLAVDIEGGAGS
jgi:hypothetical protein